MMGDMTAFRVFDPDGRIVRSGAVAKGHPIDVDRIAGERLYVYAPGRADLFADISDDEGVAPEQGSWVEQGAYAGPEAIEAQPNNGESEPYVYAYGEYNRPDALAAEPAAGADLGRCRTCRSPSMLLQACIGHDGRNCLPCERYLHRYDVGEAGEWVRETASETIEDEVKIEPPPEYLFGGPASGPSNSVLTEALRAVYGDREATYGHPRDDFERIAIYWRAHVLAKYGVDVPFDAHDVSKMQRDVKDSRLIMSSLHRDSWADIAGYAAAGARAVGVDI